MAVVTRRQFGRLAAGAGLVATAPFYIGRAAAAKGAKVVVIGGGPGGLTVAGNIKAANPSIDVTLIEPKEKYTTCFYSNLYLGGFRSFSSITHDYEGVKKRGITVVSDVAAAIDPVKKTVALAKGGTPVAYDRLVVAPGIAIKYDSIAGYSPEAAQVMPHAWQGGTQTWLLKEKLLALPDGGLVVMTVPPNPYRCPPGPYERACMIGHFLKTHKPKSKLLIFDAKKTISKQAIFEEAFREFYDGIIELHLTDEIDNYDVARVDPKTGEIETKSGRRERAALANVIPAQKAGSIAAKAGLTEGDWCPVHPENFTSTKTKDIWVLGDASTASEMPKSAFSANSQGAVAAADIVADLTGKARTPGKYRNTCWSMVAPDNSAKIGGDYTPGEKDGKPVLETHDPFISKPNETDAVRKQTYEESAEWYTTFVTTLFGKAPLPAGASDDTAAKP